LARRIAADEILRLRAAVKNSVFTANVREAHFHGAVVPHRGMTTQNDTRTLLRTAL
jgi:hypothetical protein